MMMYARAQRSDFDDWNTPGWSAEDMIPYLKKVFQPVGKTDKRLIDWSSKHTTAEAMHPFTALKAQFIFQRAHSAAPKSRMTSSTP